MHHFKLEDIAKAVNNEAKAVQPALSFVVISIVLTAGIWKWLSIGAASAICKTLIGVAMASYMLHRHTEMKVHKKKKDEKDAETEAGVAEKKRQEQEKKRLEEAQK